jgi:hypothetical protein
MFSGLAVSRDFSDLSIEEKDLILEQLKISDCSDVVWRKPVVRIYLELDRLRECQAGIPAQLDWIEDSLDKALWSNGIRNNTSHNNTTFEYELDYCSLPPDRTNFVHLSIELKDTMETTIVKRSTYWLGLAFGFKSSDPPKEFVRKLKQLTVEAASVVKLANPFYPKHCEDELRPSDKEACIGYGACSGS